MLILNRNTSGTNSILVLSSVFVHVYLCLALFLTLLQHNLFFDTKWALCVVCPVSAEGEEQEQPSQAGTKIKRLPREVKTRLAKVARLAVCATETCHSLALALWSFLLFVVYYGQ
jgi:hypothetical protein